RPADGFHPLLSWMVTVGLFDTLEFDEPAAAAVLPERVSASGLSSGDPGAAGRDEAPTDRRGALPRPPASATRRAEGTSRPNRLEIVPSLSSRSPERPAMVTPRTKAPVVSLTCEPPDLPCDERNLVVRIAAAWGNEIAAGRFGRGSEA